MSGNDRFSAAMLQAYSSEDLERLYSENVKRAQNLDKLRLSYNDRAGEALQDNDLAKGENMSSLRDLAKEMRDEAWKNAQLCEIEYTLRTRADD